MNRPLIILVSLFAAFVCIPAGAAAANNHVSANEKSESAVIYKAFLKYWNGDSDKPFNLADSAEAPSSDDIKQYADCAKQIGKPNPNWIPGSTIDNLATVLGNSASIHFIDPKTWQPVDPGTLIRNGTSVKDAVSAGMEHGLMTLSAITFNQAHDMAVFNFSFACGRLCGNGFIVVFYKTPKGWVQSKSTCDGYES